MNVMTNKSNLSDLFLGIVCPMANESENAEHFINAVLAKSEPIEKVRFFAILDNKSTDGTLDILKKMETKDDRLKVVWAPENTCVVDAYMRGYQEAIRAGCDWILEIDAGFSHDPQDIPKFMSKMTQGYDCVFGSRFCKDGKSTNSSIKRYVVSRGGSFLINLLLGTKLNDMTSGFEMFTRSSLQHILENGIYSKAHFFQTEIKVHARKMNIIEVPIHYQMPSDSVNSKVIHDALSNLFRLLRLRFKGQL
jgi:dolichol-phosphate mannosyltransferase